MSAIGRGWIDKVNVSNTLLGLREGKDCSDVAPGSIYEDTVYIYTSEDTSGTKDPYLDVTVSEGAAAVGKVIMIYD